MEPQYNGKYTRKKQGDPRTIFQEIETFFTSLIFDDLLDDAQRRSIGTGVNLICIERGCQCAHVRNSSHVAEKSCCGNVQKVMLQKILQHDQMVAVKNENT